MASQRTAWMSEFWDVMEEFMPMPDVHPLGVREEDKLYTRLFTWALKRPCAQPTPVQRWSGEGTCEVCKKTHNEVGPVCLASPTTNPRKVCVGCLLTLDPEPV